MWWNFNIPNGLPKPQRSDTGEAMADYSRRTIKWYACEQRFLQWLWYPSIQTYQIPSYLHDRILTLSASKSTPRLRQFHDALSDNCDSERLLEKCIWASTTNNRPCTCSVDNSIAQNLDIVQQELAKAAELAICAVNANAGSDFEPFVPWYVSMQIPSADHTRELLRAIFQDRWPEQENTFPDLLQQVKHKRPSFLAWDQRLPSGLDSSDIACSIETTLRGIDITLEWLRKPPQFDTFLGSHDWSIYVSEPYNQSPKLEVLRVKDITEDGSANRRLLLVATSGTVLAHLKRRYHEAVVSRSMNRTFRVEDQVLDLLFTSCETVIADVRQYITKSTDLLHDLDMASRSNPSLSKVQFLLHMHECHDWAMQACRQNAGTISSIFLSLLPAPQTAQHLYGRAQMSKRHTDDLMFLAFELEKHASHIFKLREVVSGQIDLLDKRRNRTIGMFIAIYVPLAFATSFFGMNIEDRSDPTPVWTNTTSTNTSLAAYQAFYPLYWGISDSKGYNMSTNYTTGEYYYENGSIAFQLSDPTIYPNTSVTYSMNQIVSDLPINYNWPLWMFGAVAGALTFGSIILPLIAGRAYRSVARFSLHSRRTFRAVVSFLWISFLVVSLDQVWVDSRDQMYETAHTTSDHNNWQIFRQVFFGDSRTPTYGPPLTTVVCIVGIVAGLFAFRLNYTRKRPGQAVAWSLWIGICGIDLALNNTQAKVIIRTHIDVFTTARARHPDYYEEFGDYLAIVKAEYSVGGLMRLLWLWILLNWTFSRKGHSWSIYPSASTGR
ncbi:hypothetical protein Q7P37_009041 [Cladosporium fusiforme]